MPELVNIKQGPGFIVGDLAAMYKGAIPRTFYGKFDGLNAFLNFQAEHQAEAQGASSNARNSGSSFYYFDSYADAVKVYKDSPSEVCEFNASDTYIDGGDVSGKDIVYDVTGDNLDVGRYLSGEPEVFGSMTNGNPRNKRVQIVFNSGYTGGFSTGCINARGRRIIRLVDWLESQGVRTQVMALHSNGPVHIENTIKHFDEPLAITDIAVASHSDYQRRLVFRFTEYGAKFNGEYGSSKRLDDYMHRNPELFASAYNDELTILIAGGRDNIVTLNEDFDRLEDRLAKQLSGEETPDTVLTVL